MRKLAIVGASLFTLLVAPAAQAQEATGTAVEFGVGGGVSVPTGDFDEGTKLGWHGLAAVSITPANVPVGFQVDGSFSRLSDDTDLDLKSQLIYGTGNVVYKFQTSEDSRFHPYLIGGGGVYNIDVKGSDTDLVGSPDSQTKFGINAGAGFDFKAGNAGLFIEGRFHDVFTEGSNVQFIPITLGVRFGGS
jgi:hypothetical protein